MAAHWYSICFIYWGTVSAGFKSWQGRVFMKRNGCLNRTTRVPNVTSLLHIIYGLSAVCCKATDHTCSALVLNPHTL